MDILAPGPEADAVLSRASWGSYHNSLAAEERSRAAAGPAVASHLAHSCSSAVVGTAAEADAAVGMDGEVTAEVVSIDRAAAATGDSVCSARAASVASAEGRGRGTTSQAKAMPRVCLGANGAIQWAEEERAAVRAHGIAAAVALIAPAALWQRLRATRRESRIWYSCPSTCPIAPGTGDTPSRPR